MKIEDLLNEDPDLIGEFQKWFRMSVADEGEISLLDPEAVQRLFWWLRGAKGDEGPIDYGVLGIENFSWSAGFSFYLGGLHEKSKPIALPPCENCG